MKLTTTLNTAHVTADGIATCGSNPEALREPAEESMDTVSA